LNKDDGYKPGAIPLFSLQLDREIVAIDEALDALAQIDPRKAKVIELRFFGGLSVAETAEVLKISPQSVMRDWKMASAWLLRLHEMTLEPSSNSASVRP
jgi:DNA-directed RNA polymerase specialized sigma24 family protein